jgi:hypothetical protein
MALLKRFALLALALALAPALLGPSARAQQAAPARFAFADTTLLRDTLDLRFDELFPLADSLGLAPDTLRALAIRYRLPLRRLVHLSDSLRMPVDSVGVVMRRERFSAVAMTAERVNAFAYNSGYVVGQQSNTWSNEIDYSYALGSLVIHNTTSVSSTRIRELGATSIYKDRASNTELGWKLSRDYSVGARVILQGSRTFIPRGSVDNQAQNSSQYDFTVRTRQRLTPQLKSSVDLFGGPYDEPGDRIKRGFGSQLSSRLSYTRGRWLTQDLGVQLNGRLGRARVPERPWLDSREFSRDLRGDLALFNASPLKLKVGFRLQRSTIDRPDTLQTVPGETLGVVDFSERQARSGQNLDLGLRYDFRSDRNLNLTYGRNTTNGFVSSHRAGRSLQEPSSAEDRRIGLSGRYTFRGWSLDARISRGLPTKDQPRSVYLQSGSFLYFRERDRNEDRATDATLSKNLTSRITLKASGGVTLSSNTKVVNGTSYRTYDDYRQFMRIENLISLRERGSTTLRLQVSRSQNINLLTVSSPYVTSSASNRETRSYRAEWNWTYRLVEGLTANQQNQLSANYGYNYFDPDRNDASLEYLTATGLNAVITPRLNVTLTHRSRIQPRGGYTREPDGQSYFSPSNEDREYGLTAIITYQPSPALAMTLQPNYRANAQDGTDEGVAVPLRRQRSLDFTGGATLNLRVGSLGRLTGSISRAYHSESSTSFSSAGPLVSRPKDSAFWRGGLQFSWQRQVGGSE